MNINQLGEAILGESEAHHRLQQVVDRLTDKDCDYISVKISAIFSQIHLVAFEETVKLIQERLRILYPGGHYQCGNVAGRFQKAQVRESGYGGIP